jgi:hypothetical protein
LYFSLTFFCVFSLLLLPFSFDSLRFLSGTSVWVFYVLDDHQAWWFCPPLTCHDDQSSTIQKNIQEIKENKKH